MADTFLEYPDIPEPQVKLVVSDHHLGLKEAIQKVFIGVSRQRCRVHFMRNALGKVPRVISVAVPC